MDWTVRNLQLYIIRLYFLLAVVLMLFGCGPRRASEHLSVEQLRPCIGLCLKQNPQRLEKSCEDICRRNWPDVYEVFIERVENP